MGLMCNNVQMQNVMKSYMTEHPKIYYSEHIRWCRLTNLERCASWVTGAVVASSLAMLVVAHVHVVAICVIGVIGAYIGQKIATQWLYKTNVCAVDKSQDFIHWKEWAVSQGTYGEFLSIIKQRMPELMCRLTNDIIVNPVKDTCGRYYEDSAVQVELARNGSVSTEKLCSRDFSWDYTYKTNAYRRLKTMLGDTSLGQVVMDGCAAYMNMYRKEISTIFEELFSKWRIANDQGRISASESEASLREIRMLLSEISDEQ